MPVSSLISPASLDCGALLQDQQPATTMQYTLTVAAGLALWLAIRTACTRFNLWPYRSN